MNENKSLMFFSETRLSNLVYSLLKLELYSYVIVCWPIDSEGIKLWKVPQANGPVLPTLSLQRNTLARRSVASKHSLIGKSLDVLPTWFVWFFFCFLFFVFKLRIRCSFCDGCKRNIIEAFYFLGRLLLEIHVSSQLRHDINIIFVYNWANE